MTIVDDTVVGRDTAPTSTSPVRGIFFSKTTVWLPADKVTAPGEASSSERTEKSVSVAGNGGNLGAVRLPRWRVALRLILLYVLLW